MERLAAARAQVALRSPMQGITAGALPSSTIPVEMADYLETTPIGRAEWLLLLGELAGTRDTARRIFTDVIDRYSDIKFKASAASSPKPKVLTETEQSGTWYLAAGKSYAARMLADAGADYPWADTEGTGSLSLSIEKVAEKAIVATFKPVKTGNVYGCDSKVNPIFSDMAFHPDLVLAEYVAIFHPEVMPGYTLRYFSRQ